MPMKIEQLYREHRAGLVRLVERELHDRHEAEDVVPTAFLDAQRALDRGTIPRNPPARLAAIALNAGRRLRRRHQNAEPLEDYAVQEASAVPEIRAALASLPSEQRTAVLYRDMLGLSYDETARQMGVSVSAVTMLLHRARKRLRQTLAITAGGIGLWRWLNRPRTPQLAVGGRQPNVQPGVDSPWLCDGWGLEHRRASERWCESDLGRGPVVDARIH
jgi:RNA polymerase sigma-70 factor, ECF subfamily